MVILISGASCTGKTTLSKRILEVHNITYYSIDHLKMGLFRGDPNCGFKPTDSNEHIGELLWPILRGIIKTAIENDQDLIIEGCYIFPEYLLDFESEYKEKIIPIFICFSEEYITKNYNSGIIEFRNVCEKRDYEEDRGPSVFIEDHLNLSRKCDSHGIRYFTIDSNYISEMNEIFEFITSKLES